VRDSESRIDEMQLPSDVGGSDRKAAGESTAGVPISDYNYFEKHTVVKGAKPLADGESTVTVDFAYKGGKEELGKGADITLSVDGDEVAKGSMDATVGGRFGIDTFGIGEDSGQPVTHDYQAPFKFTGKIDKVVIEAK
jgi:arylsulfatase